LCGPFRSHKSGRAGRGDEAPPLAIDQQVRVFQDDGADQSIRAFRLDDGGEGAVTAKQFDVDPFRLAALRPPAIRVTHVDPIAERQDRLGDPGIDDAPHSESSR
jgi:hypothetical protein